ncbi:MAG: DMT family transporter [Thermoplasmatota archaeon]
MKPAAAFAGCTLIWGTTWYAIKVGLLSMPPFWGASLRFYVAALVMAPFAFRKPMGRRHLALALFVGLTLFALDYGLIYWAEGSIPSGLAAVLFATQPLFVAVGARFVLPAERMGRGALVALALALAGLALVFAPDVGAGAKGVGPELAMLASTVAAAAATLATRRWGAGVVPVQLNVVAMTVGATVLLAAALVGHEALLFPTAPAALGSLLYLAVVGSVLAFLLYWDLLARWGAHKASLIVLLTPLVALSTSIVVGERLGALQWAGSVLVLGGVAALLRQA